MRLADHYPAVRERHGYAPVDFALGDQPAARLERRFAAVDGRDALLDALDRPTIVATGVGMTGPPHLGTVGAIYNAVALQEAGLDVQFVLADLEPYHGGHDLDAVRTLADRFRAFVRDCGFDPGQGTLRTQGEARDVMHTGHLLARYYEGDCWPAFESTGWEARVDRAYDAADGDPAGPTSEAAGVHSAVLHLADFLHPLTEEYDQVVLAFGIDEHALTPATRRFLARTPVEGTVAGLHGRMVTGLGDAPKMGRSLPGSAVHLGMAPDTIRDHLLAPENDADRPADSLVFQAMCLASTYDAGELDRLESLCAAGGEAWAAAKADYADFVADLADRW